LKCHWFYPCLLCNPALQNSDSESTDYPSILHFLFPMLTPESRSADFPSLTDKFYFNTAAESIPPQSVFSAIEQYCRDKSLGMDGREPHFSELERCRETAAELLQRSPGEVSFCSCTSEAYNLLHSALQLSGTDEVVITDLDFPSGATPWIGSSPEMTVRLWENSGGALDLDDLQPLLNENTKLVQVSLVSFLTGYRIDWIPFRDAVRSLAPNAILAVDVTQCFGRVELDCLDADWLVASSYKWLLGIHGGCVVSVSEKCAERLTTHAGGWFHIRNAFDADRFTRVDPVPGAASFSVGMPGFAAIYAMRAGMDYLKSVGIKEISQHADPIVARIHVGLAELGIETMSPSQPGNSSGIVAFQHERDEEIHAALLAENIHVMRQAGRVRIAVHGYNQMDDAEKLLTVLAKFADAS